MPHRKLHDIVADQKLVCVTPTDKVSDVAAVMHGNHVGSALVLDGNKVKGIFTGSNLLKRVIEPGLDPKKTAVAEVMTPDPASLHCQAQGIECISLMRDQNIRHVVVHGLPNGEYGIVSVRDFPNEEIGEYDKELEFEHAIWERL